MTISLFRQGRSSVRSCESIWMATKKLSYRRSSFFLWHSAQLGNVESIHFFALLSLLFVQFMISPHPLLFSFWPFGWQQFLEVIFSTSKKYILLYSALYILHSFSITYDGPPSFGTRDHWQVVDALGLLGNIPGGTRRFYVEYDGRGEIGLHTSLWWAVFAS